MPLTPSKSMSIMTWIKLSTKWTAVLSACAHLSGCGIAVVAQYSTDHEIPLQRYPNKASVLHWMGQPNRVECRSAAQQVWTYESDPRWKGLFLWALIIPIPLMAPIGKDRREFIFDGEETIAIKSNEVIDCTASFFLVPNNPIGRGGADAGCRFFELSKTNSFIVYDTESICKASQSGLTNQ